MERETQLRLLEDEVVILEDVLADRLSLYSGGGRNGSQQIFLKFRQQPNVGPIDQIHQIFEVLVIVFPLDLLGHHAVACFLSALGLPPIVLGLDVCIQRRVREISLSTTALVIPTLFIFARTSR
jgi:hypothetical protein